MLLFCALIHTDTVFFNLLLFFSKMGIRTWKLECHCQKSIELNENRFRRRNMEIESFINTYFDVDGYGKWNSQEDPILCSKLFFFSIRQHKSIEFWERENKKLLGSSSVLKRACRVIHQIKIKSRSFFQLSFSFTLSSHFINIFQWMFRFHLIEIRIYFSYGFLFFFFVTSFEWIVNQTRKLISFWRRHINLCHHLTLGPSRLNYFILFSGK